MKLNEIVTDIQNNLPLQQAIGHWVGLHYGISGKVIWITADEDTDFLSKEKVKRPDYEYTIDLKVTDVTSSQWQYESELTNPQQNV